MIVKFIEATNGPRNWGKFAVMRFDRTEWERKSVVAEEGLKGTGVTAPACALLRATQWSPKDIIVLDLQTGEGARFRAPGKASYDLNKHQVWVCPLFEPFLNWLYEQPINDNPNAILNLPDTIDLPDAPFALSGYRRPGST